MKLLSLTLSNFKGAASFTLLTDGQNASIFGDNGTGKTTLFDAYTWCLFGKDSLGQTDFDIKSIDAEEGVRHGLEHSVEAEFESETGLLTLKRVYREVWEAPRGKADRVFGGHTTDYFVNTVPTTKRDYEARVATLCDEKTFRLLSDPIHFNARLNWKDRREMLLKVCGDVDDAGVIAMTPALAELPKILGAHTTDDYAKVVASKLKAIRAEKEKIPVRISEHRSIVDSAPAGQASSYRLTISTKRELVNTLHERRAAVSRGGEVLDRRLVLQRVESDLLSIDNKLRASAGDQRSEALELRRQKESQIADADADANRARREIESFRTSARRLAAEMDRLRSVFTAEQAKSWDGTTSCPACGQALPEDRIKAAVEEFNATQAKRKAEIQQQGKGKKSDFETLEKEIADLEVKASGMEALAASLRAERDAIVIPEATQVNPHLDPSYVELSERKKRLVDEIARLELNNQGAIDGIDGEISEANQTIAAAERELGRLGQKEDSEKRIKELGDEERKLASEIEELERHRYLLEEFVRAKVRLLTEKINDHFEIARFRLFEEQVNGGLVECCEATVNGVPYASVNHAMRINAGLDIINVLADHNDFAPPVFIDGAESVTNILPTRGQQIRLIVTTGVSKLRVETEEETGARIAREKAVAAFSEALAADPYLSSTEPDRFQALIASINEATTTRAAQPAQKELLSV